MKKQLPSPPIKTTKISQTITVQAQQSPSISRFITELGRRTIYSKLFWVNFFCLFLVMFIAFSGLKTYQSYLQLEKVKNAREQVMAEMNYWETVVKKYPNYRDGYFMLATINAQLGHRQKAKEYNDKVLQLDPDFQDGREFERELE